MRGPYSDYAAPPIYVYPDRPKPGVHFSRTELFQLGVAVLALSAAFTMLYVRSELSFFGQNPAFFLAIYFPASLLAVGTGVGLHEIMHKVVAQRYGLWAEFRYNPRGLVFAFIFGGALVVLYLIQAASVNAFLAGFNMIPVMPLDGAKVWAWNKAVYVGIAAIALALIYVTVL